MSRIPTLCMATIIFATTATHAWAQASVKRGAELYVKVGCYECHGYLGQGGAAGPKLSPEPLPFEAFSQFIRTTDRLMPPYTINVLPEADLADIHAYLADIKQPPALDKIPLLRGE